MIIDNGGRLQIPKELRTKYNLENGSKYKITECDNYLKIEPYKELYTINEDDMLILRKLYLMLNVLFSPTYVQNYILLLFHLN